MSFPYSEDQYEEVHGAHVQVSRRLGDGMLFLEVWLPQSGCAGTYSYIGPVKLKGYMHAECLGDLDEDRAAENINQFYGQDPAPLPAGVVPAEVQ